MKKKSKTPALMIQATGSHAGKSIMVAGLCRALTKRGFEVAPFKPQNMSNNAAISDDGGEIGRAQALQAQAAGKKISVHMNPVLLKPEHESGSQIILRGKKHGHMKAVDYYSFRQGLLPMVIESFNILAQDADIVIVEGAGSPAEINLRQGDIANMGFAEALNIPVILLADIDRGGVIASILGTYHLLSPSEKKLLCGYVINKFRGDKTLFLPAQDILHKHSGLKSFGTLPWMDFLTMLPEEDSLGLAKNHSPKEKSEKSLHITILHLPHIANFNDFDPLLSEPDIAVTFLEAGKALPADCNLVILPGSKSVRSDLAFLREQQWDIDILAHTRRGGGVLGICGGYQMMGKKILDPMGIEGPAGEDQALGLLDVVTELTDDKILRPAKGYDITTGQMVNGFEMHLGRTTGPDCEKPMLNLNIPQSKADGAIGKKSGIMGCYLHGIFDQPAFRQAFLSHFASGWFNQKNSIEHIETALDLLGEQIEQHCDVDALISLSQNL